MAHKRLNKGLLKSVLSVQTTSEDDEKMRSYIRNFATKRKFPVVEDKFGNLYITKGKPKSGYPCMVSHVDTVHRIHNDYVVFEHADSLFAYTAEGCHQIGIGGDDKVGVYACLQTLIDLPAVKVAFFRKEEVGCQGSAVADLNFFKDCNFVLSLDRKGKTDFSIEGAGVELNSKDFLSKVKHLLERWSFKEALTSITDVVKLKQRGLSVCTTNISCGYYYPHSHSEIIIMRDVDRAYCLAYDIMTEFADTRFEHTYVPKKYERETYADPYGNGKWRNPMGPLRYPSQIADNEEDRDTYYHSFKKYPGDLFPHMYMFQGKPVLHPNGKHMYLPVDQLLYNIETNEYVTDVDETKEIYHTFTINDNGKEFVFSWRLFDWIDKSQAKWLVQNKSWLVKRQSHRWEALKHRGERRRQHYQKMDVPIRKLEMQHQMNMTA